MQHRAMLVSKSNDRIGSRRQVSRVYGVNAAGEVVKRASMGTNPTSIDVYFAQRVHPRVILEGGTHSPWISRRIEALGHEVVVANPSAVYGKRRRKKRNDKLDAEFLARQGRSHPSLLHPVRHRGPEVQAHLEAQLLQRIAGVGPVTALAFVLLVEDPHRFQQSREVGAYFGLVPKLDESSDSQPQLRITKAETNWDDASWSALSSTSSDPTAPNAISGRLARPSHCAGGRTQRSGLSSPSPGSRRSSCIASGSPRLQPISRLYRDVVVEGGQLVVLYRDLMGERWYAQRRSRPPPPKKRPRAFAGLALD
jgi:hypothetical protein